MTIAVCTDRRGHSIKTLVWQALRQYQTNHLFQFLHDPNAIVRSTAARELQCRPESEDVFNYAVSMLESSKVREREIGAFLLGQIGTPNRPFKTESVPLLEALCTDAAPDVRATALASLGHLHSEESLAIIRNALNDPERVVRETVSEVLEWFD